MLEITNMSEMDSAGHGTDDIGDIVIKICSERACAECKSVMRIINRLQHSVDILFTSDNSWQVEYGPCGIIGMDRHIDVIFIAGGHYSLEEIYEIVKEVLLCHILISIEKLLNMSKSFRLPAGHNEAVGICIRLIKENLRINGINDILVIGKNS